MLKIMNEKDNARVTAGGGATPNTLEQRADQK